MTIEERDTMRAIQSMNRKMKDETKIDWEQRRYEIAKDMLASFLSNSCSNVYSGNPKKQAADTVQYAEALIAELKNNPIK